MSRFDYDWYMDHANGGYAKNNYSHRLDEYGIWEVTGEDPNPDIGGHHYEPFIALMEGKLDDVIHWAVNQSVFWVWGAGGKFTKRAVSSVPEYTEPKKVFCDDNCGALYEPKTLEDYKLAYEHWHSHRSYSGCSHGR